MENPWVNCTIEQGELRGKIEKDCSGCSFYSFMGIPYAKPPVGPLRFRDPEPPDSWNGIRDATQEGSRCYAVHPMSTSKGFQMVTLGSEDCLYLNVYTPVNDKATLKPVMVFIPGGVFIMGSSARRQYGPEYLLTGGVVLVTLNHRLGALGFLQCECPSANVSGNAGLKDLVMALKWVQKNIKQFGGNPNNVTIFGQGSGGVGVNYLILSPLTKGLFHRAILQSGCALNTWAHGENSAVKLAKHLDYEGENPIKVINFLTRQPVEQILAAQHKVASEVKPGSKVAFGPGIEYKHDQAFLCEDPAELMHSGNYKHVEIMMGYNSKEALYLLSEGDPFRGYDKTKAPVVLSFFHHIDATSPAYEQKTKRILEYYNKTKEYTSDKEALINLLTDTHFLRGLYVSAKAFARTSKKPVYFYKFSVDAALNLMKKIVIKCTDRGATNADELGYLFKHWALKFEPNSFEEETVKRMVKIWTNFARTGCPTGAVGTHDKLLNVEWRPVGKCGELNYVEIGRVLTSNVNLSADTMRLWDEINAGLTNFY